MEPAADPAATFIAASSGGRRTFMQEEMVPGSGPLVLLVEDNAVNREVAVGMLENLGYRTESAGNGMLALEAVSEATYAAVLMDCQMPIMDGLTATAEIRRREARTGGARLVIVALTANAMEGNRDRCLAAGMDDFLSKPFTQLAARDGAEEMGAGVAESGAARARGSPPPAADTGLSPLIDAGVLRDIAALGRPALLTSLIDLVHAALAPLDRRDRGGRPESAEDAARGSDPYAEVEHRESGRRPAAALLKECETHGGRRKIGGSGAAAAADPLGIHRLLRGSGRAKGPPRRHDGRTNETLAGARPDGATILVVDDDPGARLLLGTALEMAGFRVTAAADGPSGVGALSAHIRPTASSWMW